MMNINIFNLLEIVIGFASGVVIGAGFVSILTVLGIIPRLVHLSKSKYHIHLFPLAIIFGVLFGTYLSITDITWNSHPFLLIFWGVTQGIFNGIIAAALAEILNVFPLLAKRVGLEKYILLLLMAIVLGKIVGSLIQWLYLVH